MYRRHIPGLILLLSLVLALLGSWAPSAWADEPLVHTVRWRDTLTLVARMYSVTVESLVKTNQLANPNSVYVGQRLRIPASAQKITTHIVARGETLLSIAAKYNVRWWDIALRNNIANLNLVYVGQALIIPQGASVTGKPTQPQAQEEMLITEPVSDTEAADPVAVNGWGSSVDNALAVDILDASGNTIGQGSATIEAALGKYGPFSGLITFTRPSTAQLGRIQIYSIAARDGAIEHLASVTIKLKP